MTTLRPSAAHIWTRCPGFVHLSNTHTEVSTDPAREGTCAAWVAEMVINRQAENAASMVGQQHENGWTVDENMAGFVQDYVDLLRQRYGDTVRAEMQFWLNEHIGGTPDGHAVYQHAPGEWTLAVDDLKYGFEIVEPWDNPQVMIYAGAIARNTPLPHGHAITRVILGIYQPRAMHTLGPYRTWEPSVEELSAKLTEIIEAGRRAMDPNSPCVAGSWCRRCDKANVCTAVAHEAYRAVSTMRNQDQRQMTAEEMATELDFLDLADKIIKGRRDAVHAEAEARITAGEVIPGWNTERGRGQRAWIADPVTVQIATGIDPRAGKMVTPAELERRGADKETVAALTNTPQTKPKLKRHSSRIVAAKFGG